MDADRLAALRATRMRLVHQRKDIINGMRSRLGGWNELTDVCTEIERLDRQIESAWTASARSTVDADGTLDLTSE